MLLTHCCCLVPRCACGLHVHGRGSIRVTTSAEAEAVVEFCGGPPPACLPACRSGQLTDVSLLVFDEAHHTRNRHPCALVMSCFYERLPGDSRPQVREPRGYGRATRAASAPLAANRG